MATYSSVGKALRRPLLCAAALLALVVFPAGASRASPVCVNDADCIPAGFDYFVTQPGTFFTINGTSVGLAGIPDPSNFGADTIVQRLSSTDLFDFLRAIDDVNLVMTQLDLTGVDHRGGACPGGNPCDVFIHLDLAHPTLGLLSFTQTAGGEVPVEGTFTSFFDVFFDLSFTTLGGAPLPCDSAGDTSCLQPDLTLTGRGSWTDDNGGLFIVGGQAIETHESADVHVAQQIAPVPEPASIALLSVGLVGLVGLTFARRGKKV